MESWVPVYLLLYPRHLSEDEKIMWVLEFLIEIENNIFSGS